MNDPKDHIELSMRDLTVLIMSTATGAGTVDEDRVRVLEAWALRTRSDAALLALVLNGELVVKAVDNSGENNHTFRRTTEEEKAAILQAAEEARA